MVANRSLLVINLSTALSFCLSEDGQPFDYESFFQSQVDQKKMDNSYRIFKKVSRIATEFPKAIEYSGQQKNITVWCSNDYLGMSWHPKVQQAVM